MSPNQIKNTGTASLFLITKCCTLIVTQKAPVVLVPGTAAGSNRHWYPMLGQVMNQPGHSSSSEQGSRTSVENLNHFEMALAPTGVEMDIFCQILFEF